MIQNKTIERLEKSRIKLSVSVSKDETSKAYGDLVTEYTQKAQIKGFRPGKVPVSVLESKFGDSLRMEAAQKVVEDNLKVIFDEIEDRPLPYAQPVLDENFTFKAGEDFSFIVNYDAYPKVTLGEYKGLTVEESQVTIGKEDIEKELEAIREQNAITVDSEGPVADGDTVTTNFHELDDKGEIIAGTKREDFTFTLGQHGTDYHIDDDIKGMTKNVEKIIVKEYTPEYEHKEYAGKTIRLAFTVTKIRHKELPTLDDELAQDVDEKFKTLDDLKKDIKTRLEKTAASRVRQNKIKGLVDQLVEKYDFELPDSMVNAELYSKYENMVRQLGGREQTLLQLLNAQGSSPDALIESWRDQTTKDIKAQVVIRELVKLEKIELSQADIDEELAKQADAAKMSVEETKDYFEKNDMMDYLRSNIEERKLFDALLAASQVKKGPKVKYVDLLQNNS